MPSQRPTSAKAASAVGRPGLGARQDRVDARPAAVRRTAGAAQQRAAADLGLPAADRAAAARQPVRVDRDVADLAAVAGRAGERLAVDDQAAADADLARR